jgi:hypothetical protein
MMLNTSLRTCDVCPMCKRPFGRNPKSRSGNNPGLEKQAEKELKDITKNCKKAYEMLEGELHLALTRSHRERYNEFHNDGWLCSEDMRSRLGPGDWPRRVRQLSEEYGVVIERKMAVPEGGKRKVAFYRLGDQD